MDIWVWIYGYSMDFSIFVEISSNCHRNFVECVFNFLKFSPNFVEILSTFVKTTSEIRQNVRFRGPPRAVRLVVAACGASATSEKTRPWNFGACILCILSIFVDCL